MYLFLCRLWHIVFVCKVCNFKRMPAFITLYNSAGYFCPVGSSQMLSCSLGQYCETHELSTPTGNCTEGYFCNGTASQPDPAPCDMGYYCPTGTTAQQPCPPGTYAGMYHSPTRHHVTWPTTARRTQQLDSPAHQALMQVCSQTRDHVT